MNKILLLVAVALLSSCSSLPEWVGGDANSVKKDSNRISVLKVGSAVTTDITLRSVEVNIPKATENYKWLKSSGHSPLTPDNIVAPKEFRKRSVINVGEGGTSSVHLNASPVIAEGMIYIIDMEGEVSAYDAAKPGRAIWRYKLDIPEDDGDFSSAGLLYHSGRIYIAPGYNSVIALNAKTGSLVWRRNINSIARSAPDAFADTVLVNTIDNKLYALDAENGSIKWTHSGVTEEISVFGSASPIAYNNIVLAPYSSGELYALKLNNGNEIWYEDLALNNSISSFNLADIDASPVIVGDKVYAISNDGVLTAIDLYSGKRVWENEVSGNKTPWYSGGYLYILNDKDELICVYAKTGGVKWVSKLPSYEKESSKSDPISWSGPVMASDMLLLVGSHGTMYSVSPKDGEVLYRNKIPDDIFIAPVVAHNQVYLLTNSGKLVILRYSDVGHGLRLTEPVSDSVKSPKKSESFLLNFIKMFKGDESEQNAK